MRTVTLPSGDRVSAFGMGTWNLGDRQASRAEEIATLRLGLDSGLTLIDTAEMYGEGRSESLIADNVEVTAFDHLLKLMQFLTVESFPAALCSDVDVFDVALVRLFNLRL